MANTIKLNLTIRQLKSLVEKAEANQDLMGGDDIISFYVEPFRVSVTQPIRGKQRTWEPVELLRKEINTAYSCKLPTS